MSQRQAFVLRAIDPGREATMTGLCVEFGISRKTGYKWVARYREGGFAALENMSRRPRVSPLETSAEMAIAVVALRRERPRWGPKKLRAALARAHPERDDLPSERTIDRILERAGEPKRKRKKRFRVRRDAPYVSVEQPNDLWTVDFKGWWRTGDGTKVEPLTIRDAFARNVLAAELLESGTARAVRDEFIRLFRRHGLPKAIQSDNGTPFGCTTARGGLTRLSSWFISLGIEVIFSRPGHPQDNGGHERMHLDITLEVEEHAEATLEAQRRALQRWRHDFNHHRPHEAIGQRVPSEVYRNSPRRLSQPRIPCYPAGWTVRKVASPGRISVGGNLYYVGSQLIGHRIGLEPLGDDVVRVWLFKVDLGELDLKIVTHRRDAVTEDWASSHLGAAK